MRKVLDIFHSTVEVVSNEKGHKKSKSSFSILMKKEIVWFEFVNNKYHMVLLKQEHLGQLKTDIFARYLYS